MTSILRLALLVIIAMAWTGDGHAQDRSQIERGIKLSLVDIALIERERARPDVADDFAAQHLAYERRQLATKYGEADKSGQGRAIRNAAQRDANRIIRATLRTPHLRDFPDPARVRADLAARPNGANATVVAGRQAGRLLMLSKSLKGIEGGGPLDEDTWPADVAQRYFLYILHFLDIRDRMEPTLGGDCSQIPFTPCPRRDFHQTLGAYQHNEDKAQETAAVYFPEGFRARFVDSTGIGGSRIAHAAEQAESRARRAQAERERQARDDASGSGRPLWIILGGLPIITLVGLLLWLSTRTKDSSRKPPLTDNHGTAQWAPPGPDPKPTMAVNGVFLGKYGFIHHPDEGQTVTMPPVYTSPETHTLIVAPSRTGKGTRIIVPTLLTYQGSILVVDPKGENAAITASQRAVICEDRVHVLNPWAVIEDELKQRGFISARYNPLDVIQRGDPDAVSIAHTMAETICARTGDPRAAYWEGSASAILTAVFLWLAHQDEKQKTLARVRQIITLPQKQLAEEYFRHMASCPAFGGAIAENIGPFTDGDSKDMPSILRTLAEATRFISDERLKEATAWSSFDLRQMPFERMTVYLVIPPTQMKVQGTWLRLMLAAASHAFRSAAPRWQTRGMMLIDELPALGRIPELANDLATMSGYGLDYTLIVQDMGQLTDLYKDQSQTILANCTWKWFSRVRDNVTAKYLSETLGQRTVGTTTVNEGTSGAGETAGTTYGEMGRALLMPDEIMNLHRNKAIVLPPEGRPILVRPVDHWKMREEFFFYANTSMTAFYNPPVAVDENPYLKAKPPTDPPA